jgi:hypothetical protein
MTVKSVLGRFLLSEEERKAQGMNEGGRHRRTINLKWTDSNDPMTDKIVFTDKANTATLRKRRVSTYRTA